MSLYQEQYRLDNLDEKVYYPINQIQQIEELTELSLVSVNSLGRAKQDQEFANKIRNLLQVGQKFNSYRDLCNTIGITPANGGKNKKKQKARLKRFFQWISHPNGEIIITEIGIVPLDPRGKYTQLIQNILLFLLLKSTPQGMELDTQHICCIEVTTSRLYTTLGLRNPRQEDVMYQLKGVSPKTNKFKEFKEEEWADAMMNINHKFNQIVRDGLESMQNRGLIVYEKKIKYKTADGRYLLANDQQKAQIVAMENQVLFDNYKLNPSQKFILFKENKWWTYKEACKAEANKKFDWNNYYWIYQIIFIPNELVKAEVKKFPNLTNEEIYQHSIEELVKEVLQFFVDGKRSSVFDGGDWARTMVRSSIASYLLDLSDYFQEKRQTFEHYKRIILDLRTHNPNTDKL